MSNEKRGFINPYNFVRWGKPSPRMSPTSHEKFAGLSGRMVCELINITPLCIPDSEGMRDIPLSHDPEKTRKEKPFLTVGGKPFLPGAGLKGMLRSVAEAASNSCFSILTKHLGVFRDNRPWIPRRKGVGRMRRRRDGRLQLNPPSMRVERVRFPRSGLFNQINIGYSPRRGNPAATGEVIPVEVQRLYERMVDDENFTLHWDDEDQRPNEAQRRWLLDFSGPWWFRKGRIDGRELVLNFGRNFRYKWAYDPREAIPEAFHPCEEPDELCPCCGLFGMVAEERAEEISKVRAVAGRIAVGPGQWVGGTQDLQWVQDHKILGTPKYSCRSFYLEPEKRPRDNTPPDVSEDEFLRLEHGRLKPAPARGRKFYWHHTKVWDGRTLDYLERRPLPNGERPLETDQNARIQVLMPDASFEFVVEFENLRPWEMGLLLWVLALPDGEDCAHHLGLGKPIGLGTVKVTIKRVEFIDRKERYESLFATGVKVYEPVNLDAEPFATYLKAFRERMSGWGGTLFHKLPNIADLLVILSTRQPAAAGPNVPITYPPGFEVTDNPSWNPADPAQAPVGESAARQAHPTELHFHWFGSPTRDWVRTLCEIEGIPRPPRRLKGKEWSEGLLDIQAIARGSCQTLVEPLRT